MNIDTTYSDQLLRSALSHLDDARKKGKGGRKREAHEHLRWARHELDTLLLWKKCGGKIADDARAAAVVEFYSKVKEMLDELVER